MVSLLGAARCNVVVVRLASDMDLSPKERDRLAEAVGPTFYFSKDAQSYSHTADTLPHDDPEIASGFQAVLDIVVRNWDDGERNMARVGGVPVWFDYGASMDPRYQNVYQMPAYFGECLVNNINRVSERLGLLGRVAGRPARHR